MRIVADENIPCASEALGPFGELRLMPGRAVSRADVAEADALIVRSVTRVDAALLSGSRVRFVGTATIGTDHLDLEWLSANGIGCASAPGCNAESVAQYVAAVLCLLAEVSRKTLAGASLGVAGVGHCGGRVARVGRALGMNVVECDPPLARRRPPEEAKRFRPLADMAECDFISFHVPMIRSGPDATVGIIGEDFLERLRHGACLINASRGGVADGPALLRAIGSGRLGGVALDVWPDEPGIDPELLSAVDIATPHVAGYSVEGKLAATETMHGALCRHLGREPFWSARSVLRDVENEIVIDPPAPDRAEALLRRIITEHHRIMEDDAALRRIAESASEAGRRAEFDRLRRDYPPLREFGSVRVRLSAPDPAFESALRGVGFSVGRAAGPPA